MKKIDEIKEKLDGAPLTSLTGEDLTLYFGHRLESILLKKSFLVRNELEYLLSETGPGNRRIDPELLSYLIKGEAFVYPRLQSVPETENIIERKRLAEVCTNENINSKKTQQYFFELFQIYLTEAKIVSTEPFIVEGVFENVPVACLIKNGSWVLPNKELFAFLMQCQKAKRFPIIITKKISGILFPVFKELFVLGVNLYKVYLPKEFESVILDATTSSPFPGEIKYNNQFLFINPGLEDSEKTGNGLLKGFFENTLKGNIANYYAGFIKAKIEIKDNFADTVSQFRKNKASKGLMANYQNRMALLKDLKKLAK